MLNLHKLNNDARLRLRENPGRDLSMLKEFEKLTCLLFVFVIFWCLLLSPVPAAEQPPAEGSSLPPIKLLVPDDPQARSYLGLPVGKEFTIPEIKAQVVIIEIFNMY
jgi:hypothetical protein